MSAHNSSFSNKQQQELTYLTRKVLLYDIQSSSVDHVVVVGLQGFNFFQTIKFFYQQAQPLCLSQLLSCLKTKASIIHVSNGAKVVCAVGPST